MAKIKDYGKPKASEKQCSCGDKRVFFVRSYYLKVQGLIRLYKRFICARCKVFYSLPYHVLTKSELRKIEAQNERIVITPVEPVESSQKEVAK